MDHIDAIPAGQGDVAPTGGRDSVDAKGEPSHSQPGQINLTEREFLSDSYKMDYPKRGTAVIINNKKFQPITGMGERTGTDVDANSMYGLLDKMGFEKIFCHDNLTAREMVRKLQEVARQDHKDSSCFVCVILTHGEEGYVFGTDDKVPIDDLVAPFKGHNCKSLAAKPKIFFIQACRGTELDSGIEVADASEMEVEMEEDETIVRRIPTEADFLMAYSVVPGYFAWRNSARGSWFIQAIVDVFTKYWDKLDLLTLMTRVNKKVAYDFESNASREYMNRKKQIPCITSMLTKDVYFKKK
ncbi:caspase-3-like [Physella acuta]|uniref:caspase-3-like n=1 Tax=Physella acuta TaxID=109671 RepID=UPI0027DB522E|nr:caspase-3-like [Physella acuta]